MSKVAEAQPRDVNLEELEDADLRGRKLGYVALGKTKFKLVDRKTLLMRAGAYVGDWLEKVIVLFSRFGNPAIYDKRLFPWVAEIENQWPVIRRELDKVMPRRAELPGFHQITEKVGTITHDDLWKTYFLAGYGRNTEENSRHCPETTRLLKKIPGMQTAFFSILSPGKHIPVHRGPYNGVLRFHLGLITPEPQERCRIRVGNDIHIWKNGEAVVFDDTYLHEVRNDTDGYRAVLFVDFARPLKFPMNLINRLLLKAVNYTSVVRQARANQVKWEKRFYRDEPERAEKPPE